MIHIVAFLIITIVKIIKWVLIKTRLYIVAAPAGIVLIFFKDWYEANVVLADIIGIALVFMIAVSWIITLTKYIKIRKQNKEMVLDWAYERYGAPIVLTRKNQK